MIGYSNVPKVVASSSQDNWLASRYWRQASQDCTKIRGYYQLQVEGMASYAQRNLYRPSFLLKEGRYKFRWATRANFWLLRRILAFVCVRRHSMVYLLHTKTFFLQFFY